MTIPAQSTSIDYYYDSHPTKEDLMGESRAQSRLTLYLMSVLQWYFRAHNWFIIPNLNIYATDNPKEYPILPDIAVFIGVVVDDDAEIRSWRIHLPERPPPPVVFEFSSKDTWRADISDKPTQYAALGSQEYFAYDPNRTQVWRPHTTRLRGWRLTNGTMVEITPDARGWLWSTQLESWLGADDVYLRLYDTDGNRRLTADEGERAAKEKAWARLRELGIDPSTLA